MCQATTLYKCWASCACVAGAWLLPWIYIGCWPALPLSMLLSCKGKHNALTKAMVLQDVKWHAFWHMPFWRECLVLLESWVNWFPLTSCPNYWAHLSTSLCVMTELGLVSDSTLQAWESTHNQSTWHDYYSQSHTWHSSINALTKPNLVPAKLGKFKSNFTPKVSWYNQQPRQATYACASEAWSAQCRAFANPNKHICSHLTECMRLHKNLARCKEP